MLDVILQKKFGGYPYYISDAVIMAFEDRWGKATPDYASSNCQKFTAVVCKSLPRLTDPTGCGKVLLLFSFHDFGCWIKSSIDSADRGKYCLQCFSWLMCGLRRGSWMRKGFASLLQRKMSITLLLLILLAILNDTNHNCGILRWMARRSVLPLNWLWK